MHITYEYHTNLKDKDIRSKQNANKDNQPLLGVIDKRIDDLRTEQVTILNIYNKLTKFLHINAIHPFNDDILDYLRLFIREEQMKNDSGVQNNAVIEGLVEITKEHEKEMRVFRKTLADDKDSVETTDILNTEDIFPLVGTLYRLSINGQQIREQVDNLKLIEDIAVKNMEKRV